MATFDALKDSLSYDDEKALTLLDATELHETVKKMKLKVERTKMENIWIESFIRGNAPDLLSSDDKKEKMRRITFAYRKSRMSGFMGKFPETAMARKSFNPIDPLVKAALCEQEKMKLETDMKTKQKQNDQDMKSLNAEIQEAEISRKEYSKTIVEFNEFVLSRGVDPTTNKISSQTFINFFRDLTKSGKIITDSIRMKTAIMKSDCRKQKRLVMKREELSSCLRPVDFELAMIEKKRFQKLEEEKQKHFKGLRQDEHDAVTRKNKQQKLLLEATIEHNRIESKANFVERIVNRLKHELDTTETEIEKLRKSIQELEDLTNAYEAPSVNEYIEKHSERTRLKNQLKITNRKMEVSKAVLINLKRQQRKQIEINKNHQ